MAETPLVHHSLCIVTQVDPFRATACMTSRALSADLLHDFTSPKSVRRSHTSRELRMLGQIEEPPPKRVRRPTRGAEEVDNSCEATRKSNMICPITCGCRNSLLDILAKTRVVSNILRAQQKAFKNNMIACFGHSRNHE